MEKDELWRKFNMLPAEAQREMTDFMDFLLNRYARQEAYMQDADKKFVEAGSNGNNGRNFSFSKGIGVVGASMNIEAEIPLDRRFKL